VVTTLFFLSSGLFLGWNFFAGRETDRGSLSTIVSSWVAGPILTMVFSALLYYLIRYLLRHIRIGIILQDAYTRAALVVAGAFGAYSLGANNIANVMGVFVPVSPFPSAQLLGLSLSSAQQLFFLGGLAIAVGIFTYSRHVMETVGNDLYKLSPVSALIVVLSSALVLFLFASQELRMFFAGRGIPWFPLVPISSSQAVVGGVLGIGLAKGGRNINLGVLGRIGFGWVGTPLAAGLTSFLLLLVVQNLFLLEVYR
jgi:PiT family inorganic phosphate transporter